MRTQRILLFVSLILVLTFSSFINSNDKGNASNKFVVVLDAGHGGKDPGNLGNGYKEKDIALNVVLAVGKELEKNPNIEVVYTRKTDKLVDLFVRGQIANKARADLFVSIHCNSHNSQAYGTETFVLGTHRNKTNFEVAKKENSVIFYEDNYQENYAGFDPNSPESAISILLGQEEYLDQSILLASYIQSNFTNNLKRHNRKVKQAGFIVLHQTVMPSVLIELGFLTNNNEGPYLNSRKGQKEMSESIVDAILKYTASVNMNVVDDVFNNEEMDKVEENHNATNDMVTFKVQIAASSKNIETKPYNFKGLESISRLKEGNLYKYFYGYTSNYDDATQLQEEAKKKGYATSFIVAFKDNQKIELAEAIKTTSN